MTMTSEAELWKMVGEFDKLQMDLTPENVKRVLVIGAHMRQWLDRHQTLWSKHRLRKPAIRIVAAAEQLRAATHNPAAALETQ